MIEYFLNLFTKYRELKAENARLLRAYYEASKGYADLLSGKTRSSRIAGMNFKQVDELKNYYINNQGSLPNDY